MMPDFRKLLSISKLHAGYGQDVFLKNINFTLAAGECVALLGSNGSGKTTLLRCMAGLLKNFTGEISIRGENVRRAAKRKLARFVASIPQNATRPGGLTVRQTALLGRYPWLDWSGFFRPGDYAAVERALAATDMQGLADRNVQTLSGGEWQRCLLARAVSQIDGVSNPLLVLDEIAAGLDLGRAIDIFRLLMKMRGQGAAIVVSIHDCNLAAIFATHILALKQGEQLFYGTVKDIFTGTNLEKLYGMPIGIFSHPDLGVPQAYPRFYSNDCLFAGAPRPCPC